MHKTVGDDRIGHVDILGHVVGPVFQRRRADIGQDRCPMWRSEPMTTQANLVPIRRDDLSFRPFDTVEKQFLKRGFFQLRIIYGQRPIGVERSRRCQQG